MDQTSLSLLNRLRQSPEPESWQRLSDVYSPLIRAWLRKYEVQDCDAEDLLQEVLLAVVTDLQTFHHSGRAGAFRGWLRAILVNRLRNFWRSRDRHPRTEGEVDIERRLAELEDPASQMTRIWNDEHDQHVLRQLLVIAEPEFAKNTWNAFKRLTLDGVAADEVARELGISLNAVFIAKSRVLSRLRQEAEGLVDASSRFSPKC